MKIKFGTLEIELEPHAEFKDQYNEIELPGGFALGCYSYRNGPWWVAYMSGPWYDPWYDDSDLEGSGETPQEAMDSLHERVVDMCARVATLTNVIK